jgi:dTDP-4-amino-4,6-dideoxygalactose transaminase
MMNDSEIPIFVTQPALPPLNDFVKYLEQIWETKTLTNNGSFHQQFEKELCDFLGVKYISLFANGTLALVVALQALKISGEVITTPFSFVASTHAIWWNNIKPVFIDIDSKKFNLNPNKIEAAITPQTTAILPVHVYGNPCDVAGIKKIADKNGLKIIYDACHTFNVRMNNIPILEYGDLSVLSFHATKVFTTFEGGAIICHDEAMKRRIDDLKNFGFADETTVVGPGINAKMNEVQAAMGLLQLKHVRKNIEKRKIIASIYRNNLKNVKGIKCLQDIPEVNHCYSYFPILIEKEKYGKSRDEVYETFKLHNIFTRRYFYPLISQFPTYQFLESAKPGKMPVAERIAEQVICLPIYPDLREDDVLRICNILKK